MVEKSAKGTFTAVSIENVIKGTQELLLKYVVTFIRKLLFLRQKAEQILREA